MQSLFTQIVTHSYLTPGIKFNKSIIGRVDVWRIKVPTHATFIQGFGVGGGRK